MEASYGLAHAVCADGVCEIQPGNAHGECGEGEAGSWTVCGAGYGECGGEEGGGRAVGWQSEGGVWGVGEGLGEVWEVEGYLVVGGVISEVDERMRCMLLIGLL